MLNIEKVDSSRSIYTPARARGFNGMTVNLLCAQYQVVPEGLLAG